MRRPFAVAAIIALLSPAAFAQFSSTTLRAVDVYRSDQISADQIRQQNGSLLDAYARLRYEGRKSRLKEASNLKAQLEGKVRAMGKFAFVDLYYGDYATSAARKLYITFDVVDEAETKTRMPFRPAPKGHLADPGGLLEAWQQYDQIGLALTGQGLLSSSEHASCSGYYCRWGSSTPELASWEAKLSQGAEPQKKALMKVAREDAEPARRAAALYALSYIADGNELAKFALEALEDPSVETRAAALQIVSDIAVYHKTIFVDLSRIVAVLDYPTVSDRSKALGMLVALADLPTYRPYILTRAAPLLLALLRMDQPCIHDLAFTLLAVLSQAAYDGRDYDSWGRWLENHASSATVVAPEVRKKHAR
ncbi:MAG: hypothetical protein HY077_08110 [Elusimicrobia bacterium]|nr:hypothetical protein [Elusimicrobiota bacterium]